MPTFFTGSSKLVRATTSATLHTIATTSNAAGAVNLRNDAAAHAFAVLDDGTGSLPGRRVVIPPGKSVKLARGTQQTTLKITNASVLATPGYLRKNDKFREFVNLSNAANNIRRLETILGRRLPLVLSLDFDDCSAVVRDYRPKNNYIGDVNGLLPYVSPSTKYTLRENGFYQPDNTIVTEYDIFGNPLGSRIEEGRTNLLLQSADIRFASPWSTPAEFTSIQLANSIFQDQVAWKYSINAINADRTQLITVSLATAYTLSCIVEQVSAVQTEIGLFNGTVFNGFLRYTWATQALSVVSGTVSSSSVTDLGVGPNGGKLIRLAATITSDAALTSAFFIVYLAGFERTSGTAIIHHAQIEAGSFPTSPIVTTTAAVTRSIDNIALSTSMFPFSATVGTVYNKCIPYTLPAASLFPPIWSIDNGSALADRIEAYIRHTNGISRLFVVAASVGQVDLADAASTVAVANTPFRSAAAWQENDFAYSCNGANVGTDVIGTVPTGLTTFRVGRRVDGIINPIHIKQLIYVPDRNSNTELQSW